MSFIIINLPLLSMKISTTTTATATRAILQVANDKHNHMSSNDVDPSTQKSFLLLPLEIEMVSLFITFKHDVYKSIKLVMP